MKNRIDDFIETLNEDEVSQLMYRISKRVLIPHYYTKGDIKFLLEECYQDSESVKKMIKELKFIPLDELTDFDLTSLFITTLIEYYSSNGGWDDNLYHLIQEFVSENGDEEHDN
jgi:hypothetical protein